MACKKIFLRAGVLTCKEDPNRDAPLYCRQCENYKESDSEVTIELVYRHINCPHDSKGRIIRFTMPNIWSARKCLQRNMQNYLKPRVFQDCESFEVAYLSEINFYSYIGNNLLPCRTDVVEEGMCRVCDKDGFLY